MAKPLKRLLNPKTTIPPSAFDPTWRREWLIVGIITLIAAVLRLKGFGHLGLTHFDEGIYAFAGLWPLSPRGFDPQVVPYAPPIFPLLIGGSYLIFGVSDVSAILVAIACGVLTIPVVAWVGRRTFGPGAGAAAAAFAALSTAHIAFSRKALTDAPFLLFWMTAIGIGGWFLERPRFGRAIALGLAVGILENVKYNGWLAGVVVACAAVFGLLSNRDLRTPRSVIETFGFGVVAGLIAGLCYVPWYFYVEGHGGYAGLVRHQRSYLGPAGTWLIYLQQQLDQVIALSGGPLWGALSWTLGWFACAFAAKGKTVLNSPPRWNTAHLCLGWLLGATALAAIPDLAWWIGLTSVCWLSMDPSPARRMLASFWMILSLITPFYHPYARLWLPLQAAGWVLLGGTVVRLGPFSILNKTPIRWEGFKRLAPGFKFQGVALATSLILAGVRWGHGTSGPLPLGRFFEPTDDLRNIAADVVNQPGLKANRTANIEVLARRPLYFYLALHGANPVRLLADGSSLVNGPTASGDWALWDEIQPLATTDPTTAKIVLEFDQAIRKKWPVRLDPVTLLDNKPEAVNPRFQIEPSWIRLRGPLVSPDKLAPGPTGSMTR